MERRIPCQHAPESHADWGRTGPRLSLSPVNTIKARTSFSERTCGPATSGGVRGGDGSRAIGKNARGPERRGRDPGLLGARREQQTGQCERGIHFRPVNRQTHQSSAHRPYGLILDPRRVPPPVTCSGLILFGPARAVAEASGGPRHLPDLNLRKCPSDASWESSRPGAPQTMAVFPDRDFPEAWYGFENGNGLARSAVQGAKPEAQPTGRWLRGRETRPAGPSPPRGVGQSLTLTVSEAVRGWPLTTSISVTVAEGGQTRASTSLYLSLTTRLPRESA